jgi:hypothetical protein
MLTPTCLLTISLLAQSATAAPIFRFETGEFWLNLHHFLYVLGRAEAKTTDSARQAVAGAPADEASGLAGLTDDERTRWREAVHFYASGLSRKDLIFDDPLPAETSALADARDAPTLAAANLDGALRTTLERVAPLYRRVWWPAHRAANNAWQTSTQALVDRYGRAVLAFITRAYMMEWPAGGYPVHVAAYANWAGAYSTSGNLLVVSSLDPGTNGAEGLETVFHEGMHQWDTPVNDLLWAHADAIGKRVAPNLSHAMIFFTAGEAVRHVLPDHVPSAEALGVWGRGWTRLRAALEETWKPYLDGRGTRDAALDALVKLTAIEKSRPR